MEVIWQVTDDNSTVNDVGRGRGAQETLDMGGGRQWREDGATKQASSNRKLPRQGNSGKGELRAFDVGPPCIGPNVRGVYDNPHLSYAGTG
jgi:hypothetical protein